MGTTASTGGAWAGRGQPERRSFPTLSTGAFSCPSRSVSLRPREETWLWRVQAWNVASHSLRRGLETLPQRGLSAFSAPALVWHIRVHAHTHTHKHTHPWGRARPSLVFSAIQTHRWPFNYVGKEASGPHTWIWHPLLTEFAAKPGQVTWRSPLYPNVNLVSLCRPGKKPPRLPDHKGIGKWLLLATCSPIVSDAGCQAAGWGQSCSLWSRLEPVC